MSDRDTKKAELVNLFSEVKTPSAPRKPRVSRAQPATSAGGNVINLFGNGLAAQQIAGGDIHNTFTIPRAPRQKIIVTPGEGVITEEQKVRITELRAEWMALHASIKKAPLTHSSAWTKINQSAMVTSYHLIPLECFDQVVAFIKQEMAKLRAMRSAPAKDDSWRAQRISAIKARSKNQLGDPDAYKAYIKKNFGADSLADLATDELKRTYGYIMAKKPAKAST